jgi:hypothetical protein
MDLLTIKFGEATAKLLVKHGKEGVRKLLTEPLLQRAASHTQFEFEGVELRDALVGWAQTDHFVQALENLKDGKRNELATLVRWFIDETDFYLGDETEGQALRIVEVFLARVLDELYKSSDGVSILAKRQEVLQQKTEEHVTTEASRAADRVIAKLSDSEDSYKLLTRLVVGVLKHQVKRYLGDDVVLGLTDANNDQGQYLLDVLNREKSSSELAGRIGAALRSAANELEREQFG